MQLELISVFETTPKVCYTGRRNVRFALNRAYFLPTNPERLRCIPAIDSNGGSYVLLEIQPPRPLLEKKGGIVPTISSNGHTLHVFPDKITITLDGREILSFPLDENTATSFSQFLESQYCGKKIFSEAIK